jgi:hypothetical protein
MFGMESELKSWMSKNGKRGIWSCWSQLQLSSLSRMMLWAFWLGLLGIGASRLGTG